VAVAAAQLLMGKHKACWNHAADCGDFVVIVNAKYVRFNKGKWDSKVYYSHSGYPGALKAIPARKMREIAPTKILEKAIYGNVSKSLHKKETMKRLFIYPGPSHLHLDKFIKGWAYNQGRVVPMLDVIKRKIPGYGSNQETPTQQQ
jgi:large subunit ribosomal protein L13